MKKLPLLFLYLFSLEYLLTGLLSSTIIGGLISIGLSMFLLVAPIQLLEMVLSSSGSGGIIVGVGTPGGGGVLLGLILAAVSIVGGLLGFLGTKDLESSDFQKHEMGKKIWRVLILLAVIITLWNIIYVYTTRSGIEIYLGVAPSILWTFVYIVVYSSAIKSENLTISNADTSGGRIKNEHE